MEIRPLQEKISFSEYKYFKEIIFFVFPVVYVSVKENYLFRFPYINIKTL